MVAAGHGTRFLTFKTKFENQWTKCCIPSNHLSVQYSFTFSTLATVREKFQSQVSRYSSGTTSSPSPSPTALLGGEA